MNLPNRETIQMLWKVKKLVRDEFNVTIQINQKDLEPTLLEFAQKTTTPALRMLISQLVSPSVSPPVPEKETTKKQVIYRGQSVSLDEPA